MTLYQRDDWLARCFRAVSICWDSVFACDLFCFGISEASKIGVKAPKLKKYVPGSSGFSEFLCFPEMIKWNQTHDNHMKFNTQIRINQRPHYWWNITYCFSSATDMWVKKTNSWRVSADDFSLKEIFPAKIGKTKPHCNLATRILTFQQKLNGTFPTDP